MLIVKNTAPQKLDVCAIELETVTATFEALLTAMNNKGEYVFDPLAFNVPVNALVKVSKEISTIRQIIIPHLFLPHLYFSI